MFTSRLGVCLAAVLTVGLGSSAALAEGVLFADDDAPPAGDGTTWDTAYRFLQDALADAAGSGGAVSEIRVAQGTYQPDRDEANPDGTGDRGATFQLLSHVALRGGYLGLSAMEGEDPDERDIEVYETVLTGDLIGDDSGLPDDTSHGENSLHVVNASGVGTTAVLDGVTITGGNANLGGHTTGGGILNSNGSPTIRSCTIRENAASTGAGMENTAGSPRIVGCRFTENLAVSRGGGVRNTSFGSPMFVDCIFDLNDGGAVGGAIESDDSGGGTPEIIACTFTRNFVTLEGGAISAKRRINITNSLFIGNSAVRGGAIRTEVQNSGAIILGCTFNANVATLSGGAISSFCNSGCTTNTRLVNCIAWGNTPDEISGQQVAVTFSDVQGGIAGTGNINADPLFLDPVGRDNTPGTGDEDLRVQAGSRCIDAGDNSVVDDCGVDLDGNLRRFDDPDTTDTGAGDPPIVDMGAYEFLSPLADCNDNAVHDDCDISEGTSRDCNCNGTPDECEIADDPILDADGSGILDECEEAGDLDGDGEVAFSDLLLILGAWGPCDRCPEDIDDSGDVGFTDLLVVLGEWGPCE